LKEGKEAMDTNKVLLGKRLLIVDDEIDILETLTALLNLCKIDRASSFEEAKKLLERYDYDLVVLDIMGVKGFDLLEIANKRNIPALMLTAHSLNVESLTKSIREGAAYFVPKEKMAEIATYAADVLQAKENNKNPWTRWFDRLAGFFDVAFTGPNWREQKEEFLEKIERAPE
jgi:DNA-binding NtrC family response regulator